MAEPKRRALLTLSYGLGSAFGHAHQAAMEMRNRLLNDEALCNRSRSGRAGRDAEAVVRCVRRAVADDLKARNLAARSRRTGAGYL